MKKNLSFAELYDSLVKENEKTSKATGSKGG